MGKEWYHLRSGIKGKSSSSSSSSNSKRSTNKRGTCGENNDNSSSISTSSASASANAAGCISAVFQLFDFHQFHIPLHQRTSYTDETNTGTNAASTSIILKGIEAPRNSLELKHHSPLPSPSTKKGTRRDQHIPLHSSSSCDDVLASVVNILSKDKNNKNNNNNTTFIMPASSSDLIRKDQHLLPPAMGIGQIKTSRDKNFNASSSEIASSPGLGTRTPTLVARLMGLDLLPDSASSSPRSSSTLDAPAPIRRQSVHASQTPQHHRYSSIGGRKSCSDVDNRTCRSLPDTPKMSLARRSDVNHHHHHRHLSLSLRNKENAPARNQNAAEEFDFSRFKKELKCSSENGTARSPNHYARQIVKQVKESISMKVRAGMMDITNTVSTRSSEQATTIKKPCSRIPLDVADDSSMSCSPRLKVLEETNRTHIPQLPAEEMRTANTKLQCYNTPHEKLSCHKIRSKFRNDGKVSTTSASSALSSMLASPAGRERGRGMKSKQLEEPFVKVSKGASGVSTRSCSHHRIAIDRKGKMSVSSCGVRKSVGGPTAGAGAALVLLPVRKDPSPPATKIPQKLVHDGQISKIGSQAQAKISVVQVKDMTTGKLNTDTTMVIRAAELLYASEILRSVGLERDTRLSSFTGWRSPSHPLDPSIFYCLETIFFSTGASSNSGGIIWFQSMNRLSDRKLVFELVDELLADILKPYWEFKPLNMDINVNGLMYGWELMDKVKARIERYPRAKCEVLEDIDMIIDKDLTRSAVQNQSQRRFDEDGDTQSLASELELRIWDDIVREEVVCYTPP